MIPIDKPLLPSARGFSLQETMAKRRKLSSKAQGIYPMSKKKGKSPWHGFTTKPKYPTGFLYHSKQGKPDVTAAGAKGESRPCGEQEDKSDDQSDPLQ